MFRGVNNVTLDSKGRFAIPARYRQRLLDQCAGKLIVTIDTQERCLLIYALPEWEKIEQQLESLPSFNHAARKVQRLLIGYATEVDMDGQGRMLLPSMLREYADLSKQSVLIGQGKKFELWDDVLWRERSDAWLREANDLGELPDQLKNLSL